MGKSALAITIAPPHGAIGSLILLNSLEMDIGRLATAD
jgi:hypothetical protein